MLLIRVILGIFYRTTEVDVGVRSLQAVPVGSGVHLVHLVHVFHLFHVLAAQFVIVMIEVSLKNQVFRRSSSAVMTSFVIDEFLTFLDVFEACYSLKIISGKVRTVRMGQNGLER